MFISCLICVIHLSLEIKLLMTMMMYISVCFVLCYKHFSFFRDFFKINSPVLIHTLINYVSVILIGMLFLVFVVSCHSALQ